MLLVITFTNSRLQRRLQFTNPRRIRSNSLKTPANKFEMDQTIIKMDKKSTVNDLHQAAVISAFSIGYSMLGKKILKIAPLCIQMFDLEDTGKLVTVVAALKLMIDYLIKQKILPEQTRSSKEHHLSPCDGSVKSAGPLCCHT